MNEHFRDLLKDRLGPGAVAALDAILKDPELSARLVIDDAGVPEMPPEEAVQYALAFIQGKNDGQKLPPSLKAIFLALRPVLNVTARQGEELPPGHKPEGLAEAALALCRFKRERAYEATLVKVDTKKLEQDVTAFLLLKAVIEEVGAFKLVCETELRVRVHDLYTRIKTTYDLLRPAVLRDPDLQKELREPEDYLYKAARDGAEQAKENRAKEAQIQTRVEAQVRPQVEQEVRASMTKDLKVVLDQLTGSAAAPAPAPAAPAAPAAPSTTPAHPARPAPLKK